VVGRSEIAVRPALHSLRRVATARRASGSDRFSMQTLPPALDVADDGLTALVDVLHRDLLLAFAAVAIERIEQSRRGAGELVRRLAGC
jgi:hypothetical protein